MSALEAETVIVTGASRGLGASIAQRFASEGANVVLAARSEDQLRDVAGRTSGETLVVPTDVTDEGQVRELVEAAVATYGELTGLINNAGIGLLSLYGERRPLHEVEPDDFRQIIAVNLTGAYLCARYAVPEMLEAGRGTLVNVSSGLGRRGAPGFGPYVASKWALEGLTRTQAMELEADGITVNAVDPGGRVDTGFWAHLPDDERASILDPDVMNDAVTLLLAQGPDGITGESLSAQEWERRLR